MATMQGEVCPVTGATNGIGKSTAHELARTGATVAIVGRDAQKLTMESVRRLEGTGVTVGALHPGLVSTGVRKNDPGFLMRTIWMGNKRLRLDMPVAPGNSLGAAPLGLGRVYPGAIKLPPSSATVCWSDYARGNGPRKREGRGGGQGSGPRRAPPR